MKKRKLLWQIFSSFLGIVLVFLFLVAWFASTSFRDFYMQQVVHELDNTGILARSHIGRALMRSDLTMVDDLCKSLTQFSNRLTVILPNGEVIGDSVEEIDRMENHGDRPEFLAAMRGRTGVETRFSKTLQKEMIYVAQPLIRDGEILAVVRVAKQTSTVKEALRGIYGKVAMALVITALLATFFILSSSKRISRPFETLKSDALRFVKGELEDLPESHSDEIGGLARAINLLASRLDERTITITQQRNEVEAILSSMVEAVLAVDQEGLILKMNKTMVELFNLDQERSRGKKLAETIRIVELSYFVQKTLTNEGTLAENLVMYLPQQRFLRATGTRLRDSQGRALGAVIVLNDVTRLKQLEDIRREFVANVSHELRTPVTSIKGFVETLEGGAIEEPDIARRFLGIISRHSDRLHNIIEDLLSLSRIEQDQSEIELELEAMELSGRLRKVLELFRESAEEQNIDLAMDCEDHLRGRLHPNLFDQAVFNLVDNAMKYSGGNSLIRIRGYARDENLIVEVTDQGPGIPSEHLDRLFERFYRVDKARNRSVGGTGLGLSIVKHIVQAHGGRVEVDSVIDQGTTFRIILPMVSVAEGALV